MENSLHIEQPVPLARPRGAHRFEVFSLKLNRRLTFYQRSALEQWVLIEADPAVITFCERPGFVQSDGQQYLADFWVRYVDRQELVLLSDSVVDAAAKTDAKLDATALTVRSVKPADLVASRTWIENWQRMLPCIVATRGLTLPSLVNAIERFVARPRQLLAIEREFSTGDPILVRAAVFGLLHSGRVCAQGLRTDGLSLLTEFVAAEKSHEPPKT
ncbi:hypothetical protein [Paraburkholderia rhynchosiae]|uniref:TnsA endonuclease N-terminal domain-containing protein n=1 Tax=Paraburkholderia rhynchosiae TaxID=487049 RepID=A0A2N7W7V2_9BURK|nr:hypothetical protein [Paraburkholderia rhynchosiae]PMS25478.1 hypothetical protein C0Z16_29145 [Paraburkholderia rhynchosiae]CAB3734188.1 hypothetical protein LMG27174_06092 [Paraburkholderia rhynchosiae]